MNDLQQDLDALIEHWKGELHPTHWSEVDRDKVVRTIKQYENETAPYLRDIATTAKAALDYYSKSPYPSLSWEEKEGDPPDVKHREDTYRDRFSMDVAFYVALIVQRHGRTVSAYHEGIFESSVSQVFTRLELKGVRYYVGRIVKLNMIEKHNKMKDILIEALSPDPPDTDQ